MLFTNHVDIHLAPFEVKDKEYINSCQCFLLQENACKNAEGGAITRSALAPVRRNERGNVLVN